MINTSLRKIGFRTHELSEEEQAINRQEQFLATIKWNLPYDVGCTDLTDGFDWDMREIIECLMHQEPAISPSKTRWHKCVASGKFFSAVDNNMALRAETHRVMTASGWRVPIKVQRMHAIVKFDNTLSLVFITDKQDHPMFQLFPHLNVVIQPDTNYMYDLATDVPSHDFYVQGQIWITPYMLIQ